MAIVQTAMVQMWIVNLGEDQTGVDREKVLSIDAMPCYNIVVFIINKLAVDVQEYKYNLLSM